MQCVPFDYASAFISIVVSCIIRMVYKFRLEVIVRAQIPNPVDCM